MSPDLSEAAYEPVATLPDRKEAEADPVPPLAQNAVSAARIYLLCVANFGISGAWALEFAITTPFFEKALNSGAVISHAVWIVGPLSGLIVAPLVGSMSDRCTSRYGRRRPFIFAGIIATIVGMLAFSNAVRISLVFFNSGTPAQHYAAIVVAVLAFCVLDLAINTTMWPIRALQGDLVPHFQQHQLQSVSLVLGSLGDLCVNYLIHTFDEPVSHITFLFFWAVIFYTATVTVLLIIGRETPARPDDPAIRTAEGASVGLVAYLRGLPTWMWRVGGTYALGFFALFCVMPNVSSWIGSSVLNGSPNAPAGSEEAMLYEHGVKLYGQAGLPRAFLSMIISAIYPFLLRFISPGQVVGSCFVLFSTLLLIFSNTSSSLWAQIIVILMAFPMASLFTVPVGVTVENSDESNRGRYLGALNCFAVIPQLIDTLYTGYVSRAFGEATVMRIGAIWGIITAVSGILFMDVSKSDERSAIASEPNVSDSPNAASEHPRDVSSATEEVTFKSSTEAV